MRYTVKELGSMTPDKAIVVQLPDDVHREVRIRAVSEGVYVSDIMRALIRGWLDGKFVIDLTPEDTEPKK